MTIIPIVIAPDPVLKKTTVPIAEVNDEIRTLMDDMIDSMHAANGIGLAAPQVGDNRSVIVMDVSDKDDEPAPIRMANPEIIDVSDEDNSYEEGCLSLPEHYAEVVRPDWVKIRYLDENNETQELHADGLMATCIQHEIDHLNGILFVDHISSLKRNMILRKLTKLKKQGQL